MGPDVAGIWGAEDKTATSLLTTWPGGVTYVGALFSTGMEKDFWNFFV